MELLKVDLVVPDHATLVRRRRTVNVGEQRRKRKGPIDIVIDSTGRKFCEAGGWARAKHGEIRRSWRKPHLLVDAAAKEIIAHEQTASARGFSLTARPRNRPRATFAMFAIEAAEAPSAEKAAQKRHGVRKLTVMIRDIETPAVRRA